MGQLERLTEAELVKLLERLEDDDDPLENILPQYDDNYLDELEELVITEGEGGGLVQEAVQDVRAEVHSHKHYYLLLPDNGTLVPLPNTTSLPGLSTNITSTFRPGPPLCSCPPPHPANTTTTTTSKPGSRPVTTTTTPASPPRTTTPAPSIPGLPPVSPGQGTYSCGQASSATTTNFVSPGFPGLARGASSCSYWLVAGAGVCQAGTRNKLCPRCSTQ